MVNGMYSAVEAYCCAPSDEERLHDESRKTLEYLKAAHRRIALLLKQHSHYRQVFGAHAPRIRNPLCGPMCRDIEGRLFQQQLLLRRFHSDLNNMVNQYNRMNSEADYSQTSTQADWEEVMEMAKMPVDVVASRSHSIHNSHHSSSSASVGAGSSACGSHPRAPDRSQPRSADRSSPMSGATATASVDHRPKAIPPAPHPSWCPTPPIEEVVELRQRLRELERSPLFTDGPLLHKLHHRAAVLAAPHHPLNSMP
ncbi:hypothetical protein LPJ61_003557 [Coemansia biformis]|uniref:Uncharacterized protein n=1 Tax=Coemansia biformis TaxID=1286918 RepID=A0A9W7YDM5_9FUNG|nr:hypothetical protein LPJ61_003557 [Coemansia biformis]